MKCSTLWVQAANLFIENGGVRPHRVRDRPRRLRPGLEDVLITRDEAATATFDVRERTEAVILGSKIQSGLSNGSGMRSRRLRGEGP